MTPVCIRPYTVYGTVLTPNQCSPGSYRTTRHWWPRRHFRSARRQRQMTMPRYVFIVFTLLLLTFVLSYMQSIWKYKTFLDRGEAAKTGKSKGASILFFFQLHCALIIAMPTPQDCSDEEVLCSLPTANTPTCAFFFFFNVLSLGLAVLAPHQH
jgi:hypothetical protein